MKTATELIIDIQQYNTSQKIPECTFFKEKKTSYWFLILLLKAKICVLAVTAAISIEIIPCNGEQPAGLSRNLISNSSLSGTTDKNENKESRGCLIF